MPANPAARRLLLLAGAVLLALLLAGLVTGAIGAAFLGREPLLSKPEVHLAPQPVTGVSGEASGEHGEGPAGLPSGFVLTNTLLSSWIATVLLLLFFFFATRRMSLVPGGLQNFAEWVVETLHNFVQGVVGPEYGRRFFPMIATIFLFVAVNAWLELLPIYQSLGFKNADGELSTHLLRAAATDLNMPLAIALVSFVFVEYWGLRAHGTRYLGEFFRVSSFWHGIRRFSPGLLFQGAIDIFVGLLEFLSHGIRVISFTFRLFGNITAGEILLLVAGFLVPFVALLPFYGLELLVGFIQALIFAGLTLGFVAVAVAPHEGEGHSEERG
ncbi:MAG: F0F1 ATP synthase subunit A [Chloroflexi bacterium]|nr:F0F1 ATP synthase subunit A [Chloroflexota bacterium]